MTGSSDGEGRADLLRLPVSVLQLSVRARNCLKLGQITTIGQLLDCSEEQLLNLPNLGKRTLSEIQAELRDNRLLPPSKVANGSIALGGQQLDLLLRPVSVLPLGARAFNSLLQLGISTVGELTQCPEQRLLELPNLGKRTLREIQDALMLHGLTLGMSSGAMGEATTSLGMSDSTPEHEEGTVSFGNESDPGSADNAHLSAEHLVLQFIRRLDQRQMAVLQDRVLGDNATLEVLGIRFGVTRERIRQIERRLLKRLTDFVGGLSGSSVMRRALDLREDVGTSFPASGGVEAWRAKVSVVLPESADCEVVLALLLYLAGPYKARDGWMIAADLRFDEIAYAVASQVDERGWISPTAARRVLLDAGIQITHHTQWLVDQEFVAKDGGWWPRKRSIPERVIQVLRYREEPVTAEELYPLVGCESERSLRSRLLDDERFKKTSKQGHFALREWAQYSEYTGISEELAEEIERQGGRASPQHLVDAISSRFGVKANSVYQYLSAPMFFKDPDGRIRLRTPEERLQVEADPNRCAGLYRVLGSWILRIEINRDTLRGSGRPLATAVAVLAACQPGERRTFISPCDQIVISWPAGSASGPSLGSVKPDVDALGGEMGDFLFLVFGKGRIEVRLLKASSLPDLDPGARLASLLGLEASASPDLRAIGTALGVSERNRAIEAADLHEALMRRNELWLANLVSLAWPTQEVGILERLEQSLGL